MITIEEIKIDIDALKSSISEAGDLNDNEIMFERLSEVAIAKKQLSDALDKIETIEAQAKNEIDSRAKALYGNNWQAIVGQHYKITKSSTGNVYTINPDIKPAKKWIIIKESVNTAAVNEEIQLNGKLPKGVEYNPSRGTMIRINLK